MEKHGTLIESEIIKQAIRSGYNCGFNRKEEFEKFFLPVILDRAMRMLDGCAENNLCTSCKNGIPATRKCYLGGWNDCKGKWYKRHSLTTEAPETTTQGTT
jgi:hypothetical protein